MTDSRKDNAEDAPESTSSLEGTTGATPAPDDVLIQSNEPSESETSLISTPSSEEIAEIKPNKSPVILAEPIETLSEPTPTPVNVAMAPKSKPTPTELAGSPMTDSSISIDNDTNPNVAALIIDAIAAAVAIAFIVLLTQDVIPFL